MFILFIFLLLFSQVNCLSSEKFYKKNLLNENHNIIVLQPNVKNFIEKVNTTDQITNKITLYYQHQYSDIYIDNFIKNNSIDSIITDNDFVICQKNTLTQKYFNRTNIDLDKCHYLNDKKSLRDYLSNFDDINKVSSILINNDESLERSIKEVKFNNFIIKPISGAGSGGIFNLYYKNDKLIGLDKFMSEYKDNIYLNLTNKFIVEEFIRGTEHNLDIVMYKGKTYFWHISDDLIDMIYFQDIGTRFPSKLNKKDSLEMYQQTINILDHLNIKNGVYHFEYKLYNNKAYLIELNPRRPGGNYVNYIDKLYGSNLNYDEILISLGKEPFYNMKYIKNKPKKKSICDREYYPHILDNNSIGSILLDNNKNRYKINYELYHNDYNIIKKGNEYENAIYIVNTNKMKNACYYLEKLKKPNYVSIYKLPENYNIIKDNIIEVINGTIITVKKIDSNKIYDYSKKINKHSKVYLYVDNIKCFKDDYNCLYIEKYI